MTETFTFQAEIQQLLDILVHSLYTEREIFLRELISNASDALNRIQFEQLTNRDVFDADAELKIHIKTDAENNTLTVSDTGIGMTRDDLAQNLGVIARSGAKAFIEAMKDSKNGASAQDVIGQFGVGFYSVFMVADKVRVVSRSHHPDGQAFAWESDGGETYTIEEAERDHRGTDIIIYLKDDAKEFTSAWKIKDIIRRHSDYIAFPIYVDDDEEPTNKQIAIWRRPPKEVEDQEYEDFYRMLTLDFEPPLHRIHMRADVPMQFYALLYIPSSSQLNPLSPRREPGLKLYARKVLIDEYNTDLLPEYLNFVQGVVDSEDIPLNVSRESVQANRVMVNLKKTLTNKILGELNRMARKRRDHYLKIYEQFGRYIKQGVAIAPEDKGELESLLYFNSTRSNSPQEWVSLQEYVDDMVDGQDDIYYIVGDDFSSVRRSPHLDAFRKRGIEVLYFTDPVDPFMLMGLNDYRGHKLRSADEADIDLRDVGKAQDDADEMQHEAITDEAFVALRQRFVDVLGERVKGVRESNKLTDNPARLVSDEGGQQHLHRIQRLLDKDYEIPVRTLELNLRHPLIHNLSKMINADPENKAINPLIEQVFETTLLQEGLHPDPASMATRLNILMQAATGTPLSNLEFPEDDTPVIVSQAEGETDADDESDDDDAYAVEDAEFTEVAAEAEADDTDSDDDESTEDTSDD
ncbi:MAG: molecular chaperone HtpG [Chloroflexi bacterium]|nr:MAG: molecular chaperone HtpG [Chloroflexota bacterium]